MPSATVAVPKALRATGALMRTETFHEAARGTSAPPAVADGTSTVGHRSPSPLPDHDHALTDPTASCLAAAAKTGWAADEEEPHPYGFHSHGALISMLFLCCGGIELAPPLPTRV